jgi:hypothetical protein
MNRLTTSRTLHRVVPFGCSIYIRPCLLLVTTWTLILPSQSFVLDLSSTITITITITIWLEDCCRETRLAATNLEEAVKKPNRRTYSAPIACGRCFHALLQLVKPCQPTTAVPYEAGIVARQLINIHNPFPQGSIIAQDRRRLCRDVKLNINSNQRCSVMDCPSETAPRHCVPEKGGSQQLRQVQPMSTSCIVRTGFFARFRPHGILDASLHGYCGEAKARSAARPGASHSD